MCDSAWVNQIKIQYVKHTLRAYSLRSFLILRNWCPSVIFHISTESRLINFNFVFDTEMPYTTTSRPHINWDDPVVLITTSYSAKMWQMTTKWFDKKIKGDLPSSDPNGRHYFPSQCEHQSNNRLPQCKHEDKWVTSNGIGHTNEDFKKLLDYLHRHGWVITSYWTNEDQYLWWHYGITDTRPLWVKKKSTFKLYEIPDIMRVSLKRKKKLSWWTQNIIADPYNTRQGLLKGWHLQGAVLTWIFFHNLCQYDKMNCFSC